MPELTCPLAGPDETSALGARLAALLQTGDIIALSGDLGAGKTTLARALITALNPRIEDVPSPTYTLVQTYDTPLGPLHHLDLYRIETASELEDIGWRDLSGDTLLVEWPDRAGDRLPFHRLDIVLEFAGSGRIARLCPHGEAWQDRLASLDI